MPGENRGNAHLWWEPSIDSHGDSHLQFLTGWFSLRSRLKTGGGLAERWEPPNTGNYLCKWVSSIDQYVRCLLATKVGT
jgi:hypothetical protein